MKYNRLSSLLLSLMFLSVPVMAGKFSSKEVIEVYKKSGPDETFTKFINTLNLQELQQLEKYVLLANMKGEMDTVDPLLILSRNRRKSIEESFLFYAIFIPFAGTFLRSNDETPGQQALRSFVMLGLPGILFAHCTGEASLGSFRGQ